jgi:hypothetical protein
VSLTSRHLAVTLAMTIASGCSYVLARPPSVARLECTDSLAPPIADAVITVGLIVTSIVRGLTADAETCSVCSDGPASRTIPPLVLAIPYGVAIGYGVQIVGNCRRFKQRMGSR